MEWIKVGNFLGQEKWNYFVLIGLTFLMPFYIRLLPYLIGLSVLTWILQKDLFSRTKGAIKNIYFVGIVIFYLVHLMGMLYTKDYKAGVFNLQIKLSLIIFPLIIFTSSAYLFNKKKLLINSFIYGNILASAICILLAVYHSILNGGDSFFNASAWPHTRDWPFIKLVLGGLSYFNYSELSAFLHVSYFSMYLLMSLYFVYNKLENCWNELKSKEKVSNIVIILFFLLMILLLQSRAAIIALSLIVLYEVVNHLLIPGRIIIKIIIASFFIILILGVINHFARFKSLKEGTTEISYTQLKRDNIRIQLWERSIKIIKNNPLFGVGTGDLKTSILEEYKNENLDITTVKFYNSHNEFLETTARLGILGVGTLLFILILPLLKANNYKDNKILIAFIIIIITNFIFESMLNRINGVLFFSFFYSLLNITEKK
ncbi:MAG: O-antigen ligase family protein [Bacteroidales bacterium]|nr:O-antigen ligase family protein [Bacteroidales bacterium]